MAQIVLRLLLNPITGETNAVIVTAAVVIAGNFCWIELCRMRQLEIDRLLYPAQLTYIVALVLLWPTLTQLMLHVQPTAPAWVDAIASPVVYLVTLFLLSSCSLLLLRISFSADEFWAATRRLQGLTLMEKIWGGRRHS